MNAYKCDFCGFKIKQKDSSKNYIYELGLGIRSVDNPRDNLIKRYQLCAICYEDMQKYIKFLESGK